MNTNKSNESKTEFLIKAKKTEKEPKELLEERVVGRRKEQLEEREENGSKERKSRIISRKGMV